MAKSPTARKPAPAAGAKAPAARRSAPRAADLSLARANVLAAHAVPGRYGAVREGDPGVFLSVIHPLSVVTVIARKNRARELALALRAWLGVEPPAAGDTAAGKGAAVAWAGPDQWVVIARGRPEGALYDEAADRLRGVASVSDQSHGRSLIRIAGTNARQVLGKGSSVDFHLRAFPVGHCATTQMAHIGIHVTQVENGVFDLLMFRGFAEGFWEWLTEMAEEYGYEVR